MAHEGLLSKREQVGIALVGIVMGGVALLCHTWLSPEWTSDGRLSVSISPIGADMESIEQDSRALEALLGADTTKRVLARLRVGTSMAFGRGPNADVIEFATASDGSITCLERTSWGARQITKAGGSLPPAHARLWALFGSKNKR